MDKSRLKSIAMEAATGDIPNAEDRFMEMLDADWVQIAVYPEDVCLEAEIDGIDVEMFIPNGEL